MFHPTACPACPDSSAGVHVGIPMITQYASPGLIEAIAFGGHDPQDDPAWASSGAPNQAEYGKWCRHLCGLACLRMVLRHRDGTAPDLWALLAGAREHGAYTVTDGAIRGLIYAPAATYAQKEFGLAAESHPELTLTKLRDLLHQGWLVAASVNKTIRQPRPDYTGPRGGHLVLVTGMTGELVLLHNPSGHTPQARQATLPVEVFAAYFGARGLALHLTT